MKEYIRSHWKVIGLVVLGLIVIVAISKDQAGRNFPGEASMIAPQMDDYYSDRDVAQSYAPEMMTDGMATMKVAEESYGGDARSSFFPPVPVTDQGIPATDRMIIRSGNLTVKVDEPEKTFEEVKTYVTSIEGFIENANVSEVYEQPPIIYYDRQYSGESPTINTPEDSEKQKQVSATVRVPDERYDEALAKFRGFGYVSSESLNGQDVTASYQDNKARLENLKAREVKVREFYDRAKTVEETLLVFQQLEQLRYEIEQLESQQQNLERQTSYSTIWLNLMPNTEIKPFTTGEWNLKEVWNQSVNELKYMLRDLAELGIKVLIYSIVWVPALLIIWLIVRHAKKKRGQV